MSWAVGEHKGRDIGYGVPAICDHPGCGASIDRGLSYVCGGQPYGGDCGCGQFFCNDHLQTAGKPRGYAPLCKRCYHGRTPFKPMPDTPEWINHKLTHDSWAPWRAENPEWVADRQHEILSGAAAGEGGGTFPTVIEQGAISAARLPGESK